jgi:hypothetical protein
MASGTAPLTAGMLLGLAAYLFASRLPRRLSIPAVGAAGAVLGAALWYAAYARSNVPLAAEAVEGFLPLAAGWFVGDAVAVRRRYLAGLADQAERERTAEAEQARQRVREERVRIARELHDVVAHALAVITVQALPRPWSCRSTESHGQDECVSFDLSVFPPPGPATVTEVRRLQDAEEQRLIHSVDSAPFPPWPQMARFLDEVERRWPPPWRTIRTAIPGPSRRIGSPRLVAGLGNYG